MNASLITLTQKDLATLLTAAGRAPSGGNIQPWLVSVANNQLTIKLNSTKFGTILDVNNYGSLFALGAFCLNLEIAAANLGLKYQKEIKQTKNKAKFHLQYLFTHKDKPTHQPLYQAVLTRDTNRQLANGQLIPTNIISKLKILTNTTNSQFRLDTVSDNDSKSTLAKILGKADLIRTKNTTLLKQMLSEMRWTPTDAHKTRDGLDVKTMELPGNVAKMLQLLAKFPSMAKTVPDIALEKQAWPMLKNSSHLCVLSVNDAPSPLNLFLGGNVMQRLWLEATNLNLAVHPWTVLSFFAIRAKYFPGTAFSTQEESLLLTSNQQLQKLFALPLKATPLFIFRLSHADPPSARSLRYDWHQFTTINS